VQEFDQEIKESGVDMNFKNFHFADNSLHDADFEYVSYLCGKNLKPFYVFYKIGCSDYKIDKLVQQIDELSDYVAVKIGGRLFVTRKSAWKKMQNGYNLY
jgi:hypothetical protein